LRRYENFNGHDPVAYIVSVNLARRNLTKGQQAMTLTGVRRKREKGEINRGSPASGISRSRV